MTEQQIAEQKRLAEILRLARMQLNEEYMKKYSSAHTTWLAASRSAWNANGTLLPFTVQVKYPTEEEVVARGVEIYKTLTGAVPNEAPLVEEKQEQGLEVVAYTPETAFTSILEPEAEEPVEEVTDVEFTEVVEEKEEQVQEEQQVQEKTLENKFKSLITKWGGRGNY
jgi:hypothetical protein